MPELISAFQAKTAIGVVRSTSVPDVQMSLSGSNFGGLFYLPKGCAVPESTAGGQLYLLAQINCAELLPNAVGPPEGIVQFWIDASDDLMGLAVEGGFSDESKRVICYPEVGEHYSELEFKDLYEDGKFYTPFDRGTPLGCYSV